MKKKYLSLTLLMVLMTIGATAQTRYVDAIYTDAQIEVTSDLDYATNIDFLRSKTSNQMNVGRDITEIKTALAMSQPIPIKFFNADTTVDLKVTTIKMDVYKPLSSEDATTDRPVIVFIHTGNFLPPPLNGSPLGIKTDSSAIVLCTEWAKRGYVAVSVDYRLGWNPLAEQADVRRGQLLNAVYRAIHDVKVAVRTLKDNATTYGIDPNKVVLYGEGTGAYVALAYETLDKNEEMELTKFRIGGTGDSYINRPIVGEIDGSGGLLNLYASSTTSAEVAAIVTAGGALADTSWLEAGDAPMIAFHCVRDPFAPFSEGTVVVPTTNEDVVDVQGANVYIQKANTVGNNDAIKGIKANDSYTIAAEASYGVEFDYIYASPFDKITVNSDVKGLFPILRPLNSSTLNNEAGPWQFWDPASALATPIVGEFMGQPVSAHLNSLSSNPGMGPDKGRAYIDTILGYMCPRIALINGDITIESLSVNQTLPATAAAVYPNPATSEVTVSIDTRYTVKAINVIDITGRVVLTANASSTATLDLNGLQSGYYFIHVSTDQGMVSTKLIKE
jgi:hypothetical protein